MANAIPTNICIDIETQLNAASFSQTIEAERSYIPAFERDELEDTIKVSIINNGYRRNIRTRAKNRIETTTSVRIYVQTKANRNDLTRVDELVRLTEEIHEYLEQNVFDGAHYLPTVDELPDLLDIFDPDALKRGLFISEINMLLRKV